MEPTSKSGLMSHVLFWMIVVTGIGFPATIHAQSLEIQCNKNVEMVICQDPWPYAFDCVMADGTRCDMPRRATFMGWPPCTEMIRKTGTLFHSKRFDHVHIIRWQGQEIRFVGRYDRHSGPLHLSAGPLRVTVISKP